jgi:L-seryl-tRNA(Ser) seleniumtransferase
MFSGDKLLGGPQAGIVAGSEAVVSRIRKHPLMRAVRVDKLTYAALEATLEEYIAGRARETVPVQRMIAMTAAEIGARAEAMAAAIREHGGDAEIADGFSTIGGGSAPGSSLPTRLVAVRTPRPDDLLARLRTSEPPIVARIENDLVVLDLRTVRPEDDTLLAAGVAAVIR